MPTGNLLNAPSYGSLQRCGWPALRARRTLSPGLLATAELPAAAEVLGPVTLAAEGAPGHGDQAAGEVVRALIRVPRSMGGALAAALHAAQGVRSARKDPGPVRLQLDPAELI